MGLSKYKFGNLIELEFIRNTDGQYGPDSAIGVNINKTIEQMKGDSSLKDLNKFYLVFPNRFVYNPRGSRKLGLGYNDSTNTFITTFNNMIFKIKNSASKLILPQYLFMYLSRKEWDRYVETLSWGSSTEVFSWNTFSDETIELPSIEIQQKYVDVYNSMVLNQQAYEKGLDDLKLTCDAYIEKLQKSQKSMPIGQYLRLSELRNESKLTVESVRGLAVSKEMIPTKADMDGVGLKKYKVVKPKEIAFVPDTSRRGDKISLAMNTNECDVLVSSISIVFGTNPQKLLSDYLMLFFTKTEFDRYARFHSWGSARETFSWEEMCNVKIPMPDIKIQQAIVDIYIAYQLRKEINKQLKIQIKEICLFLSKVL